MPSSDHEILTYCSVIDPDQDQLQKIRGCMSNSVDMDRLIDLAVTEGLGGFLYKSLLKAGLLDTINPQHKQKLYNNYYLTVRQNLKLLHALNTILEPLNQKGIQVVLMQGMALLQQVYQDVGLRPMKDMDLWVLPKDSLGLIDSLLSRGFERDSLYPNTFRKGEIVLDIHTHILWADRIKARDYLLKKDQEEIFNQTITVIYDGRETLSLSPQDQFLYLGLHAIKHNFERLIWLVDLKHLVAGWSDSDWEVLLNRSKMLGQEHTICYICHLLERIFNIEIPIVTPDHLIGRGLTFFEARILKRRINGISIPTWAQLIMISNGRRFRERISFFYETLFPRPEVLRQVFANSPQFSVPKLYWRRVLQMMGFGKAS